MVYGHGVGNLSFTLYQYLTECLALSVMSEIRGSSLL